MTYKIGLHTLTTELLTGAFRALTPDDRQAFADASEHCLIGEVKRGKEHLMVIFDPQECFFECYKSYEETCYQVCTITGDIKEL